MTAQYTQLIGSQRNASQSPSKNRAIPSGSKSGTITATPTKFPAANLHADARMLMGLTSIRPNYCAFKDVIFGSNPAAFGRKRPCIPALLNMQSSLFDPAKIDNVNG